MKDTLDIPKNQPSTGNLTGLLSDLPSNLMAAADLARRGFSVFPVRNWGDGEAWKPVKGFPEKATRDLDQIRAWWAMWPDARVGLLTGEANGLTVIDVDMKNGKDGVASLAELGFADLDKMTPVRSRSPSGGWHLFFKYQPGLKGTVGRLGEGLDIRNNRQFVIAPGSYKDSTQYAEMGAPLGETELPPFPESLIPEPEPERPTIELLTVASPDQCQWAADRLTMLADDLAALSEGSRQSTLNETVLWAGGVGAHGMLDREETRELLLEACFANGLPESEFEATFDRAWNDGMRKPVSDFPLLYTADDFDDLQVQSPAFEAGEKLNLATFANGNMKPSLSATMFFLIKVNAERNLGLKFNEFLRNEEWLRGEVTDADQTEIKIWIEQAGITYASCPLHSVSKSDANDAIAALSRKHPHHPVRDWLSSLHHDGQRRAETLFIDYLGCPDTPYFRDTARLLLVAAVARIFEPGHKFDFAPIIEGAQGIRKSTFVKTLCPRADWYGDPQIDWSEDKHVLEQTQGIWLLELGELTGLRKAEVNVIKAAISRTHDKAREAYGRKSQRVARQFVMIGTTNDRDYLVDDENRRFWPIPAQVEQTDTEKLAREIPSIWAEAVAIYKQMRTQQPEGPLPLHLTGDAESHARRLQKSRRKESESDVLAGQIEHWLNTPLGDGFDDLDAAPMQPTYRDEVCGLAVWREMLGNKGVPPQSELTKIGRAIASLGWIKEGRKRHPEYGQQIIHRRPTS
ncbi:VapE domain-containing protein [Celeribacter neptunius]|uniref:Bifunctional DNA primase/polymerase, N-terminal n=1 Tax=Celeribacter neptunius TaxID=588602 RepID=A0A1I3TST6_9RHOB|nr:VapE domain-containing protein [Celeribacter neptunius]SFJ73690.1 Bifunctional DNA primase/polymerase, N-terminal [Celeribacter neptunius]